MFKFQLYTSNETPQTDLLIGIRQDDDLTQDIQFAELQNRLNLPAQAIQDFKADAKETLPIYLPTQKVYLLGLGKNPKMKDYLLAFRSFFHQQKGKLGKAITLDVRHLDSIAIEYIANGIDLASYNINLYKTDKSETLHFFQREDSEVHFWAKAGEETNVQQAIERGRQVGETQREIMQLVNLPSNHKAPQVLADWATTSAGKYGFKATILDKATLEREGLHALLGVSQGSPEPPCLIVLEYKPAENLPKVGLVGKGVTFDTGGVSIKDSNNMHFMKCDMAGAGGVLGALELCAKLKVQKHVIAVVPATQNSVDGNALKPSDVIKSYAGKTIEVIDTDAEGRIILADGLAYLNRNFAPDYLVDMATLTGSCVATLGYAAGGLFTQDDALAATLQQAGERTGERVWRLPMWDDYKGDISSDVADVRNFSGKPIAGAISAAKFLEVFTENHAHYAHIDMAGVSFNDSEFATMRSATAYGVRLLIDFVENL